MMFICQLISLLSLYAQSMRMEYTSFVHQPVMMEYSTVPHQPVMMMMMMMILVLIKRISSGSSMRCTIL